MELAVLGIGSNTAFAADSSCGARSPEQLVRVACSELNKILDGLRCSSLYVTEPLLYERQPDFINAVVCGGFSGTPRELLAAVQSIEARFGRNRAAETRYGPRTLDIDIELFGSRIVREDDLIIPHGQLTSRVFVLVPLLEILPDCADPISGRKYSSFLSDTGTGGVCKLIR